MALTISIPIDQSSSISLGDFVEYVSREVDTRDIDSVASAAPMLARLLENENLVASALNTVLKSWKQHQAQSRFNGQSLMLATGAGYIVRANVWMPPSDDVGLARFEQYFAEYLTPHNHPFTLLTGGYYGPGYETSIFEFEGDYRRSVPGDTAELQFTERTSLTRGKIMLYRPGRDVHFQEHAKSLSVSVNLCTLPDKSEGYRQYFFDVPRGAITTIVEEEKMIAAQRMLCDLAASVADTSSLQPLEDIAINHPHPALRSAAIGALLKRCPNEHEMLIRKFCTDKNPCVQEVLSKAENAVPPRLVS